MKWENVIIQNIKEIQDLGDIYEYFCNILKKLIQSFIKYKYKL